MSAIARLLLAGLLVLGGCGYLLPRGQPTTDVAVLPEGAYRLDPSHATILFKIDHLGFSQTVGRFNRVDATLDFDSQAPEASRLVATIDPASIDLNLPAFEEELRGSGWLDVARYPEARFESTAIAVTGDATGVVEGNLTLRGTTVPVTLQVTFNGAGSNLLTGAFTLGFSAQGSVSRSAFGLGFLTPAIGDEVALEIHAEFARTGPGT